MISAAGPQSLRKFFPPQYVTFLTIKFYDLNCVGIGPISTTFGFFYVLEVLY